MFANIRKSILTKQIATLQVLPLETPSINVNLLTERVTKTMINFSFLKLKTIYY